MLTKGRARAWDMAVILLGLNDQCYVSSAKSSATGSVSLRKVSSDIH
jgi:hypothetical protein